MTLRACRYGNMTFVVGNFCDIFKGVDVFVGDRSEPHDISGHFWMLVFSPVALPASVSDIVQ